MKSLLVNKTWELVELPKGKNVVGCKWVFKVKKDGDGKVDRLKARLVVQGYSQHEGVDYDEVFSPLASYSSIRSVLAIANELNYEIHQMDVKTAFLNGDLDTDIFMKQPDGFVDDTHPDYVCKLNKSIYGLKQSARCWNKTIDKYLKDSGFQQSNADPCIYTKVVEQDSKKSVIIIAFYVDDLIIVSNDNNLLIDEKHKLSTRFEMEDQGEIHYCLGMSIKRNRDAGLLSINQNAYLRNILKEFGMINCKSISTPMELGKKFAKLEDNESPLNTKHYHSLIGSLTYASIATRPDISSAVSILSQFMSKPGKEHWVGVKRILRYIKGTLNYGLYYTATSHKKIQLNGYADDWAGDQCTRRSTSGYVFQIGKSPVSCCSKRQPVVALSSTEAEYIALCYASQETIWLRQLLKDINFEQPFATKLFEDNQGTIALAKNAKINSRTKHIDIKFHFIREAIENKKIDVEYCSSDNMIADTFTKSLLKPVFEYLRDRLNGRDLSIT